MTDERFWCATCEKIAEAGEHECPCRTCEGTGKADGTPDSPKCSDCYCADCTFAPCQCLPEPCYKCKAQAKDCTCTGGPCYEDRRTVEY